MVLFSYIFMGDNSPFMELGEGGLERWVAYPVLLWALGLGGHLMGQRQAESKSSERLDERSHLVQWKSEKVGTGRGLEVGQQAHFGDFSRISFITRSGLR